MKYTREFLSGSKTDVRSKWFAVFSCDECGKESFIEMWDKFRFDKINPRECPYCHSYGKEDYINNLKTKIADLTKTRSRIDVEIEQLTKEVQQKEVTRDKI